MCTSPCVAVHDCLQHATIIEAKKLFLEKLQRVYTVEEQCEKLRRDLVGSLKWGHLCVLRMTNSAIDFRRQFTGDACFPHAVFSPAMIQSERYFTPLLRESDLDGAGFVPRFAPVTAIPADDMHNINLGWRLVITFLFADYQEFFESAIILDQCGVIVVRQPNGNGGFAEY